MQTVLKLMPAVVYIENQLKSQTPNEMEHISGLGFIVDERGYVLTNAHVIANASHISVRLRSGETIPATVIDVDQVADLALIKLETKYEQRFPTLKFSKSTKLRPGERVIVLGSPLALMSTVTHTSEELNRDGDMEYIQTNTSIAKGNSGGPLVNIDGEVVGIHTLQLCSRISFSIPSQKAEKFINAANISEKPKKYVIGINMIFVDPETLEYFRHTMLMSMYHILTDVQQGVLVAGVWPGTPASGLLEMGDIIVKIDKEPVTSSSQVYDMVQKGKPLNIEVIRGQRRLKIQVTPDHE